MNIIKNWRPKYKQLILALITFLSIIFIQNILTFSGEQQQCSPAPDFSIFKTSTGENYQWTNLRMGGGGFVTGIVIHPKIPNLIYARTDVGGLYRWQPEKQTWLQLIRSDTVPKKVPLNIESVGIDPQNPNIIYTAIGAYTQSEQKPKPGMLLKSENQGQSWQILNLALPMGGNEFWRWTGERLAVDPNNSNIVYFGSRLNGLWLSQNGGESWNQINPKQVPIGEAHPETNQKAGVSFVTFDPTSETLEGNTKIIYVGVAGQGVYHTQNAGQTWELLKHDFDVQLVPQQGVINSKGELIVTFYHSQKQPQGKVLKYTN
ncbi:MAG: WD40/YVTN/BNR-like repeat-containing protein, partial [Planktothrix sp.]